MPTRNVNLTEHFDRSIETGITSGRFSQRGDSVSLRSDREIEDLVDQAREEPFRNLGGAPRFATMP